MEFKKNTQPTTALSSTEKKSKTLQYHLVPPKQLEEIAKIMQKGEETHDEPYMEIDPVLYFDAAFRHLMAIRNGELEDQEDHMSHALHLACNGMILDRQLKAGKKLDFGSEE